MNKKRKKYKKTIKEEEPNTPEKQSMKYLSPDCNNPTLIPANHKRSTTAESSYSSTAVFIYIKLRHAAFTVDITEIKSEAFST
jgi:hypothetical protein